MTVTYRGVPYTPSKHEQATSESVEHVYRGKHYKSSLNHKAASHSSADLNYRGISYHV